MKYIAFLLAVFVLCLFLCSWVDPATVNVYSGTLRGSGLYNGFQIQYYVNDSSHLGLSSAGYLVSTDRYTVSGRGLINSYEFPIRFDPDSGFQMQDGTTWVSYNLEPLSVPSHFPFPVWLGFLGFLLLLLVVALLIFGRFVA